MVRPRTVRDALEGRPLSPHQVEEILEALESESPVLRAAALVAAYAFLATNDEEDAFINKLRARIEGLLPERGGAERKCEEEEQSKHASMSHAYKCQGLRGHSPRRERTDNEGASNKQRKHRHEDRGARARETQRNDGVVPEGYEVVGAEKVPVTEPYGWGFRTYVVKIPIIAPKG